MGAIFGLSFESRYEREKREKEYADKIFPYGEDQKKKVLDLLASVFPYVSRQQLLLHYILMKEVFIDNPKAFFDQALRATERKTTIKNTPQTVRIFRKVLEADLQIDERLLYPAPEELANY